MSYLSRVRLQFSRLPPDHRPRRLAMIVQRNLNYWLRQHLRRDRPQLEHLEGLQLHIRPGVFNPTWFHTTPVLLELLQGLSIPADARVLELCTGSGAAAIALGRRGLTVTAVDVNPLAVHCARSNVARNGVSSHVSVLEGDLYAPVWDRRFDLIVANPPFVDGVARTPLELAFFGGPRGEVLERLVLEAPDHLTPGGRMVISYSTVAEGGRIEALAARAGLVLERIDRRDLWSEVIEHYILVRPAGEGG